MNKAPIRLGPLALLLAAVSICLTILAILSFSTAQADLRLAEKYAETVQTRYALERTGQEYIAALNAGRETTPSPDDEGVIRAEFENNGYWLRIRLQDDGHGGGRHGLGHADLPSGAEGVDEADLQADDHDA